MRTCLLPLPLDISELYDGKDTMIGVDGNETAHRGRSGVPLG